MSLVTATSRTIRGLALKASKETVKVVVAVNSTNLYSTLNKKTSNLSTLPKHQLSHDFLYQRAYSKKSEGKVGELFQKIGETLNADLVASVKSSYQFVLSGEEAGKWYLDLKTGNGSYGQGDAPQKADCTLTMDSKNFFNLFSGKMKPTTAYMTGKLKIAGNLQTALKLEKVLAKAK